MKKRARNKFWLTIYIAVATLRILTPLLIFSYPIITIILVTFLDIIDVEFASRRSLTLAEYELFDKLLDFWWYSLAMLYSWFFLPKFAVFLLVLYLFRLFGNVLFIFFRERRILFFFPGFFENSFFVVFLGSKITQLQFMITVNNLYFFLAAAFVIKIIQEWWVHWAQISIPEKFFQKKRNWVV